MIDYFTRIVGLTLFARNNGLVEATTRLVSFT
jgi:hypothetical protein